jgi:hypothetical protein
MKNITPVTLMPGDYVVVAKGYNANELNGNSGEGNPFSPGDLGGGAISFASSCIYGSTGTGFAYPTNPDGGPGNRYLAGTFSYSTGSNATSTSTATIVSRQAYIATTATGNQNFGGELGMEFKVNNPAGITINRLGAFDHQGNGITGTQGGGIRVAIFNKASKAIVPGLDAIIIGNADGYTGNHRMKNITAVTLMPGDYVVVAKGYNANELNGNSGVGNSFAQGDWGAGAISFASSCRYGSTGTGFAYPTNPDGGPGNRYLAGTFSYSTLGTASSVASNTNNYIITITVKDISGNIGQANATVTVNCNQPLPVDPSQSIAPVSIRKTQSSAISQNPVIKDTIFSISQETVKVFPNPSNGQFSVELFNAKAQVANIQILTESGMLVERKSLSMSGETANTKVDFNLSNQPSGIYFVKVTSANGIQMKKIVIVH